MFRIEWAQRAASQLQHRYLQNLLTLGLRHWSREWEYPWVLEHGNFKDHQLVLDAGGSNRCCLLQYVLADMGCHVVNLDIDPTQFDCRDSRVLYLPADMRKMPFLDSSFSRVMCVSVLEHVDDPQRALVELWRVLAPGGRLIITMDVASRRYENNISNFHHVIEEADAVRMLGCFGLSVPPKPANILVGEVEGSNPKVDVRVLCFYIDK